MRQPVLIFLCFAVIGCSEREEPRRSQEPRAPLPYESIDINFKTASGDTLAGTLTTPASDTLKVAVVLAGGSGPGDRDYHNAFEHRPFLVMADYLTRQGITVLRYDERGVGESGGDYKTCTHEDLVADVAGGVKLLREKGFKKIGIIGHSEGGGMAPEASLLVPADFLVLLAAANCTNDSSLMYQTGERLKSINVNQETRGQIVATLGELLLILRNETDQPRARAKMRELLSQKERDGSDDYRRVTAQLGDADRLIEGWFDPKFIYSLRHDPKESLAKIRVPVYVLYGGSDGSIDVNTYLRAVKHALDSTQHIVEIIPGVGHLFMNSNGVPVERLHEVEETISPEVLRKISDWILDQ